MNTAKYNKNFKWKVGWGFTALCNMKCPFCYSKNIREYQSGYECSLEDSKGFIDCMSRDLDCINYGTGENCLSERWFSIISFIRHSHPQIRIGVTTNGSIGDLCMHDTKKQDIFINCIDEVDVSIDFPNKEKHDNLRGKSGAFDSALKTLNLCDLLNKPVTIVMVGFNKTLTEDNISRLFELAENYHAFIRINLLRPITNIFKPPDFAQVQDSLLWIIKNYNVISISDPIFSILFGYECFPDLSGLESFRILHDGKITPSTYLLDKEWKGTSIETCKNSYDIISSFPFKRIREAGIPPECDSCAFRKICKGGTIDRRWLWYKSLKQRDPYCPGRYGIEFGGEKKAYCRDFPFKFVHEGYLPTMIFSPKKTLKMWTK